MFLNLGTSDSPSEVVGDGSEEPGEKGKRPPGENSFILQF